MEKTEPSYSHSPAGIMGKVIPWILNQGFYRNERKGKLFCSHLKKPINQKVWGLNIIVYGLCDVLRVCYLSLEVEIIKTWDINIRHDLFYLFDVMVIYYKGSLFSREYEFLEKVQIVFICMISRMKFMISKEESQNI